MATIFTRIIGGELPGCFVWSDERCVAFLSVNPIRAGHTLVVPRAEVDHWLDLDPEENAWLMRVAHAVGRAQMRAFEPERIGLIVAGFEVPHVHVHVIPTWSMADVSFANAARDADPASMDESATRIRDALRALGYAQASDKP
jgi:histidine triad (HIT) family protein